MATRLGVIHGQGMDIELWKETVDLASIAATAVGSAAVTIAGAKTTDFAMAMVADTPTVSLAECGAKVTAANTVTVYATNGSAAAKDEGALNWLILLFRVS